MNVQAMSHFGSRVRRPRSIHRLTRAFVGLLFASAAACGSVDPKATTLASTQGPPVLAEWGCATDLDAGTPDYLQRIGCEAEFRMLASAPLDATIPGASSGKVVFDTYNGRNQLYFQNSCKYKIHSDFATAYLSSTADPDLPFVSPGTFTDEYYVADRRFILGAVTYYDGPKAWVLEIAPYDKAAAPMVQKLFAAVQSAAYFGPALAFHPTSQMVETQAKNLPALGVPVLTTDDLYKGIDYQPLNLGEAKGYLRFVRAAQLNAGTAYLQPKDIVVLDSAPNDITVVMGIITEQFQTPLSHVNVLSQNRKTPNMGLRKAWTHEKLRALADKPVHLVVRDLDWDAAETTKQDVEDWWDLKKPDPAEIDVHPYDLTQTELKDIKDIVIETGVSLKEDIRSKIPAYGGKASHYSILARIPEITVPPAFAVPIYYYDQFIRENGFDARIDALLDDSTFMNDPATRDRQLAQLRKDMMHAPVNLEFQDLLRAKLQERLPGIPVARFRSSTNSEDLEGFTGAGLYESHGGVVANWDSVLLAVRSTWAATWRFRAFEERTYRGIPHRYIGMALLVHHAFTDELANGVCLTSNPFDTAGLEPAFYVNTQINADSVVLPDPGVTTDQFLNFFTYPGQPTTYLSQSSLVEEGKHVLTDVQINQLSKGLEAIATRFSHAYGRPAGNMGWYAMDVEFKLNVEPGTTDPQIVFKQARPHPGRGSVASTVTACGQGG